MQPSMPLTSAFVTWSQTTPKDRSLLLLKLADAIEENGEMLSRLECDDTGKPYTGMLNDEIPAIADAFSLLCWRMSLHEWLWLLLNT